jgi:hypothetical protein
MSLVFKFQLLPRKGGFQFYNTLVCQSTPFITPNKYTVLNNTNIKGAFCYIFPTNAQYVYIKNIRLLKAVLHVSLFVHHPQAVSD